MMLSFVIAGFVCAVAALCYAEMAAMVPVSGSAYTYSYAVRASWSRGWSGALILEYAIAAGAVSVWSGRAISIGWLNTSFNISIPHTLVRGPFDGGAINLRRC